MPTRTEIAARAKATQKRLAAISGRDVHTALTRLSARELFAEAKPRLDASRPVVGQNRGAYKRDKTGRKRYFNAPTPVFGAPTFRNRVVKNEWV